MKIAQICNECGIVHNAEFTCDVCGKELLKEIYGVPITISFSYGSILDGEEYHFCCEEHAIQFLVQETLKQKNGEEKNDQDN